MNIAPPAVLLQSLTTRRKSSTVDPAMTQNAPPFCCAVQLTIAESTMMVVLPAAEKQAPLSLTA